MKAIINVLQGRTYTQIEENILKVVQDIGIDVDRDRLLQALTDARKFYNEGYKEGKKDAYASVKRTISAAEDEYPYKVYGEPETYSDYNQGWTDACDYIERNVL